MSILHDHLFPSPLLCSSFHFLPPLISLLHLSPYLLLPFPSLLHPSPSLLHPSPSLLHPSLSLLHPSPSLLHPSLSLLHPSPSLLHPSLSLLHPSPCLFLLSPLLSGLLVLTLPLDHSPPIGGLHLPSVCGGGLECIPGHWFCIATDSTADMPCQTLCTFEVHINCYDGQVLSEKCSTSLVPSSPFFPSPLVPPIMFSYLLSLLPGLSQHE